MSFDNFADGPFAQPAAAPQQPAHNPFDAPAPSAAPNPFDAGVNSAPNGAFGGHSPSNGGFGGDTFNFEPVQQQLNAAAAPQATADFGFGAPGTPPTSTTAGFAAPAALPATNDFGFGAPAPTAPSPTLGFSAPAAQQPSNDFGFGAPAAHPPSPTLGFSAPAAAPSPKPQPQPQPVLDDFGFGAPAGQTAADDFGFGAPAAQSPSPTLGFSAPLAAPSPAQQLPADDFGFGAPAAQPAADDFGFGAPAPQPAAQPTPQPAVQAAAPPTPKADDFGFAESNGQSDPFSPASANTFDSNHPFATGAGAPAFDPFLATQKAYTEKVDDLQRQGSEMFPDFRSGGMLPEFGSSHGFESPVSPLSRRAATVTEEPATPPVAAAGRTTSDMDEDEFSPNGGAGDFFDSTFQAEIQQTSDRHAVGEEYEVTFDFEQKLGMLLERQDVYTEGSSEKTQATVAKILVPGGPADQKGVVPQSVLVAINGNNVHGFDYHKVLKLLREIPRPIRVKFRRIEETDDSSKGTILTKTGNIFTPPRRFERWKPRFFVLGGAIAPPNVIQFYQSEEEYKDVVLRIYNNDISQRVKAFRLSPEYKVSPIVKKQYDDKSVKFFTIKAPKSSLRVFRIGSEDSSQITELHAFVAQFCSPST